MDEVQKPISSQTDIYATLNFIVLRDHMLVFKM
jgi:hypothetical protein